MAALLNFVGLAFCLSLAFGPCHSSSDEVEVLNHFGEHIFVSDHLSGILASALGHDHEFDFHPTSNETFGAPQEFAFDQPMQVLFWTDDSGDVIRKMQLRTGHIEVVTSTGGDPRGIALDPTHHEIYWTDSGEDTINVVNYDGTGKRVILDLSYRTLTSLAIHLERRELYFGCSYYNCRKIEKVNCDGTGHELVYDLSPARAYGVDFNDDQSRLYFTAYHSEYGNGRIGSVDINGHNAHTLHTTNQFVKATHWHGGKVYFIEGDHIAVVDEHTETMDKWIGEGELGSPSDVIVGLVIPDVEWHCDFDHSFCGWTHTDHHLWDMDDWSWLDGQPLHEMYHGDLPLDHTTGHDTGNYIFVDASEHATDHTASIHSPETNADTHGCVRFWYMIHGTANGSLAVYFEPNDHTIHRMFIWYLHSKETDGWVSAEAPIGGHGEGHVVLEGYFHDHVEDATGYIVVDDISFGECHEATRLVCHDDYMEVHLDKAKLEISSAHDVTLIDHSCMALDEDIDHLILTTDYGSCGTTGHDDHGNVIFSNTINIESHVRHTHKEIEIACSFDHELHVGLSVQSRAWQTMIHSASHGNFSVAIRQYHDEHFEEVPPHQDVFPVDVGHPIYIATSTSFHDDVVDLLNEHCWVTEHSDPHDAVRMDLIVDGCPLPEHDTVHLLEDNFHEHTTLHGFSFSAFTFHDELSMLYIHCDVIVCSHHDVDFCRRDCDHHDNEPSHRRRRAAGELSQGHATLSRGPLMIKAKEHRKGLGLGTAGGLLAGSGLVVLVLVGVIVALSAKIYHRR